MYFFQKGQDDAPNTMTGFNYATSNDPLTVLTPIFQQYTPHVDLDCHNARILHHHYGVSSKKENKTFDTETACLCFCSQAKPCDDQQQLPNPKEYLE
jgi:hypothetical protein